MTKRPKPTTMDRLCASTRFASLSHVEALSNDAQSRCVQPFAIEPDPCARLELLPLRARAAWPTPTPSAARACSL